MIAKLTVGNTRRALLEYWSAREINNIQSLPDDEPVFLGRLESLRKARQNGGSAMPEWV